jgi:hypothetical protein
MAAGPSDWSVNGVVCGPRDVNAAVRGPDEWCAWARGPNNGRVEGRGLSPEDALTTLALRLKELGS